MRVQTWKALRAKAVASGQLDEERVAELKRAALAKVRVYKLAEVRSAIGLNQEELSQKGDKS